MLGPCQQMGECGDMEYPGNICECRKWCGFGHCQKTENWGSRHVTAHSPTAIQLKPLVCKVGIWILQD